MFFLAPPFRDCGLQQGISSALVSSSYNEEVMRDNPSALGSSFLQLLIVSIEFTLFFWMLFMLFLERNRPAMN